MGLGSLDRIVTFYEVTETVTNNGERTEGWSSFHTCWAGVDDIGGDEEYEADQLTASNTINFRIRYYPGITTKMKLVYDSKDYNILHISEQGRQKFLVIKAVVK